MEAGRTKITNMNDYEYVEDFKGNMIRIPPHGSIELESGEAHLFRGTMGNGPKFEGGVQLPESYKWLKFETNADIKRAVSATVLRCPACGKVYKTEKNLEAHIKAEHSQLRPGTLADGTTGDDDGDKT